MSNISPKTLRRSLALIAMMLCGNLLTLSLVQQVVFSQEIDNQQGNGEPEPSDNVIDRLSGFDVARINAIVPLAKVNLADPDAANQNAAQIAEVAKLIYQINRLARNGGVEAQAAPSGASIGDVVSTRGELVEFTRVALPAALAEVMEFPVIFRARIRREDDRDAIVFTSSVPKEWIKRFDQPTADSSPGSAEIVTFQSTVTGVVMHVAKDNAGDDHAFDVIAAPAIGWLATDKDGVNRDWALLGSRGFDVGLLESVSSRSRQPLRAEDATAFYSMMRIAAELGEQKIATEPSQATNAADLLKRSAELVGRRVQLLVQSVRVTRIAVTDEISANRLGSDHYWQIDALSDLGNVVIRVETGGKEPAVFEGRYPISIATRELPAFLISAIQESVNDRQSVPDVAMISRAVVVDGFFYRMWSYESEFMKQHGGSQQFGPLVIASKLTDVAPPTQGDSGITSLGWYFAAFAILAIVGTALVGFLASRRDAQVRKRMRHSLPPTIETRDP